MNESDQKFINKKADIYLKACLLSKDWVQMARNKRTKKFYAQIYKRVLNHLYMIGIPGQVYFTKTEICNIRIEPPK